MQLKITSVFNRENALSGLNINPNWTIEKEGYAQFYAAPNSETLSERMLA
jgi:hypothetical protein